MLNVFLVFLLFIYVFLLHQFRIERKRGSLIFSSVQFNVLVDDVIFLVADTQLYKRLFGVRLEVERPYPSVRNISVTPCHMFCPIFYLLNRGRSICQSVNLLPLVFKFLFSCEHGTLQEA